MTDLPSGWALTRLSEICEINPRVDKSAFEPDTVVSFVAMPAVEAETGRIDVSETRTFSQIKQGYTPFKKNDVLFAKITPCMENGKMAIVPEMVGEYGFGSTEFHVLRPAQGVDPKYIYLAVSDQGFRYHAEHNMTGAVGQKRVPSSVLEEHELGLPPSNEQRRIVEKIEAMFDKIDKGVESLQTARTTLGLYRQSLLKSAFEGRLTTDWRAQNAGKLEAPETLLALLKKERDAWHKVEFNRWQNEVADWQSDGSKGPKPRKSDAFKPSATLSQAEQAVLPELPDEWVYCRLSDIACVGSGMSVSKARKHEDPVETPYLRVANVQRGHLNLKEMKSMPVEQSQLPALRLRTWDILFNEGGDRDKLGRGWIWEDQVEPCITQNHVFRATPFRHDKGWSMFISQWGNSFGRDYFEAGGKQTTNLASINKTVLKALPVPVCSAAEQAEIVRLLDAKFEAADALEAEIDAALTRADAFRKSILKKAFSGQLVPQDPKDEPASALLERMKANRSKAPKTKRRRQHA
ncbi:restriction endonuclease subunit S [Roseovarius confluentis]|uniref:restriction endonuclease subunit S n=1 Tax=Roseovarius confluentis TaxID=1852027 RepID=UPI003BAAF608